MTRCLRLLLAGVIPLSFFSMDLRARPPVSTSAPDTDRIDTVQAEPFCLNTADGAVQRIRIKVWHSGEPVRAGVTFGKFDAGQFGLTNGEQILRFNVPAGEKPHMAKLALKAGSKTLASTDFLLTPPRVREIWVLPHSHVDIGYTDRQARVAEVQVSNLLTGMRLAKESEGNPPGARFKWNVEAGWTIDNFLRRATPAQRDEFVRAAQSSQVDVDAMYANILTGLCQPEELAQSLSQGARLANITGVPAVTAIVCDVPGYTWGIVPMFAQAGVKYFVMGPNFCDRLGHIHDRDNKPFYWKSQSGTDRVLCWMVDNYHHHGDLEAQARDFARKLAQDKFPYEMAYLLWVGQWPNGGVDNAPPDTQLAEKVLAWNKKYAAPRIVIGLEREFFTQFESRHGREIPEVGGDLTPYWEDGAGSTARESAMNRGSDARLAQAAALFAMRDPFSYPAPRFAEAWKNAMLYSEHTWGAWCSISKPDDAFTADQWSVKQNYAAQADAESRALLAAALPAPPEAPSAIDVFNTTQWPQTGLVTVPAGIEGGLIDDQGAEVICQRLESGETVFLAQNVPGFGAKRYGLGPPKEQSHFDAIAHYNVLETKTLRVEVDPGTGAVRSLRLAGLDREFVDKAAAVALNDFRYAEGTTNFTVQSNSSVNITVIENGPIVAALRIECDAPGCKRLTRDVRVVEGVDAVEFVDRVDRKSVRQKDSVRFGFGFNIPGGTLRMETPWAVVRPNLDQLAGSCHNWFAVQRWVDISGDDYGIDWASLDAPLMEIGGMTANLVADSPHDPQRWLTKTEDSQTIYSWAQNNHWFTNYKIDQPGVTTFRYILRPHRGGYSPSGSARFGVEASRPLLAVAADHAKPLTTTLVQISPANVVAETVKMSDDGKAVILRLFNTAKQSCQLQLTWGAVKPVSICETDLAESKGRKVAVPVQIPGYGVLSLRADLPQGAPPREETAVLCARPLR